MESPSCRLLVRAQPRAKRNEIAGLRGEAVVVKVTAPPVRGAANAAVLEVLATRLGVRPGDIRLIRGEASREKLVEIAGLTLPQALERLGMRSGG
jgi:hypothetical protein